MKTETDKELIDEIEEEVSSLKKEKDALNKQIELLIIPPDPTDNKNTIVEVRAGTGGMKRLYLLVTV